MGQGVGDDQCDVRLGFPLVLAQFREPNISPILSTFKLPQDRAAALIERADHLEKARGDLDQQVSDKVQAERKRIAAQSAPSQRPSRN